ncbi:MAG: helix-turn-helix transcriptional regulator [Eubacteriales bacterium]|nr:helix-turn-helix transcriptional regulator [Eubacteriales bacterium]
MYEELFSRRLAQLRIQSGLSARDMSLSLGQNPGYINTIENGKAFPTMTNFFYICEFLHITPKDFFDIQSENPQKIQELDEQLKKLDERQLDTIAELVNGLVKKP